MEGYIFGSMLSELLRFRRIVAWVLVALGLFAVAEVFHRVAPGMKPPDEYVMLSATLVFRILPLSAAILSAAVVAQEVEQKTIVYLLTRPVPRWKLLFFRSLAAMAVVFAISAVTAVLVSVGTVGLHNELLVRDLKALFVGSAAYVSLFVFVSLLTTRAMIICLLFSFIWETSVTNIPGDMYRLTVSGYLTSIAQRPSTGDTTAGFLNALAGMFGTNTVSPETAYFTLAVLIAACLGIGAYWFSTFEYMAREDA
jgi:ABC-2 type transport system permease protein